MKIGISSYSYNKYIQKSKSNYFAICDLAKKTGFDGIEFIDLDNKSWGITDNPIETAKEIREYCDKIGLEIIAYSVGGNFLCEDFEKELKRLCACVDVANELGVKVMRHDVCSALPKKHLYNYRTAIAEMAPRIREVTEYAQKYGIKTCTENHGYIFQAPERVEELILAVNHENYGWLCDMGNFLCADCDPVKAVTVSSSYVFHVHAKDFLFKKGSVRKPEGFFETLGGNYLRGTALGHGVVDIENCMRILKKTGYDKWISIEFEGPEDNLDGIEMGYKYLKKVLAEV